MLVIISEALQALVVYGQGVYRKCVGLSNSVTIYGLKQPHPYHLQDCGNHVQKTLIGSSLLILAIKLTGSFYVICTG